MKKRAGTSVFVVMGLVAALAITGPILTKFISAAVWPIVAIGLVVCLVRIVFAATRRW